MDVVKLQWSPDNSHIFVRIKQNSRIIHASESGGLSGVTLSGLYCIVKLRQLYECEEIGTMWLTNYSQPGLIQSKNTLNLCDKLTDGHLTLAITGERPD